MTTEPETIDMRFDPVTGERRTVPEAIAAAFDFVREQLGLPARAATIRDRESPDAFQPFGSADVET